LILHHNSKGENMEHIIRFLLIFTACSTTLSFAQTVWLDQLDLSAMECGWGSPNSRKSIEGNGLSVGGQKFERGVGTHAISTYLLNLDGKGNRFTAAVGVDDEATDKATVSFYVLGDKKVLWEGGVMKKGDSAKKIDVDIRKIKLLGLLVTDAGDGINYDHADWCDAKLELTKSVLQSRLIVKAKAPPYILTPKPSDKPKINGARVFGVRPGNPFLYTIAATGKRPLTFSAKNLPDGLSLDPQTGRITGSIQKEGEYKATLAAKNGLGKTEREFTIKVGNKICLTPPIGWNSWNCWACAVDDGKVRAAADAMVESGLVNHGWTYINIDDCWEIKPDATDPQLKGELRDKDGMINTNKRFPDMKALGDYVHGKGLKLGIYSGPGPLTCAGFTASYRYELNDAQKYAAWGIDYLKYDWCSYDKIAKDRSLSELKKPYAVMRAALDKVPRDIVFSLCQYGMGNVWEWGDEVGGNCWRTTGDITDTWSSMSGIGFNQTGHEKYAGPGNWNDPDMLVVGLVGWGPQLHPTNLTPDEQYTHISLWSLLCSPLLIGCDLGRLDNFTLNLLTNDEVIEINQDPLGKQAGRLSQEGGKQIWVKEMEDGSKAVGLFYVGEDRRTPEEYFRWDAKQSKAKIVLKGSDIGITGKFKVRDVWRQKDLGVFDQKYVADVPYHGVVLLRVKGKI
jgi:alpha-galactosidase